MTEKPAAVQAGCGKAGCDKTGCSKTQVTGKKAAEKDVYYPYADKSAKGDAFRARVQANLQKMHDDHNCPIKHPHLKFPTRDCKFCNYGSGFCFYPCIRRWSPEFKPVGLFRPAVLSLKNESEIEFDADSLAEFIPVTSESEFAKAIMAEFKDRVNYVSLKIYKI